jgi:adenylate cyclase
MSWKIKLYRWLVIVVVALLSWVLVSGANVFWYDALERVRSNQASEEIIIVSIDEESLQQIGRWPWSREEFAQFHANLTNLNPNVVVYDILFVNSSENDAELKTILENDSSVILGSSIQNQQIREPIFDTTSGFTQVGDWTPGPIRASILATANETCEYGLSLEAYSAYTNDGLVGCEEYIEFESGRRIDKKLQFHTSRTFTEIRFSDIWNNSVQTDLSDSIIVVGVTIPDISSSVSDNVPTVLSPQTPGVYVHGFILDSLLQQHYYTDIPWVLSLIVLILIALVVHRIFHKGLHVQAFLYLGLVIISCNVAGILAYFQWYLFPFVELNIVIITSAIFSTLYWFGMHAKERALLKKSFGRYVDKHIVDRIIQGRHSLELGGEETDIAIFFFDIRGFTTLSESMNPTDVVAFLNGIFEQITSLIQKNEGYVDKYIGDALMAFWNAPITVKEYINRSVDTSLEIVQALEQYKHDQSLDFNFGIGLHSGSAIVGNIGSKEFYNYTVIGDSVNIASRTEGLCKIYGLSLVVTDTIKHAYTGQALFLEIDTIIVKGRAKPTIVFHPYSDLPSQLVIEYSKALQLYYQGSFTKAQKIFETIEDFGPAQTMIQRIDSYDSKPPKDWNGVWHMKRK